MRATDPDEVAASASKEVQTLYTELALHPEKDPRGLALLRRVSLPPAPPVLPRTEAAAAHKK